MNIKKRKGKILLVRSAPYDLDINTYNVQEVGLGKAFCELGFDFDFITFKRKAPFNESVFYDNGTCKARLIEKGRLRFDRWGVNLKLCKRDFLSQYDMIISSEYFQLESYLLSKQSKNVVIYNGPYYNLFLMKFLSPIYDRLFTKAINNNVRCIFVKSRLAQSYLENKGYNKICKLGVALDTERFDKINEMDSVTGGVVEYMQNHRCLLYVGALSDRKNLPFMLKVYELALRKDPTLKFVMIGKSKTSAISKLCGRKDEDYENLFFEKLSPHVRNGILRVQKIDNPQLKYVYPLAKAFLLPSKQEIFGMVLLEAMYLRTPVITSLNGGSSMLIEGKETGQIVEEFEVEQWVDAIFRYIDNPTYTEKITNNAHSLIRDEFNWKVLALKMLNRFYEKND